MKRLILIAILLLTIATPAQAQEITAPEAPKEALELMPVEQESFSEGIWFVFKSAVEKLRPDLAQGCGLCLAATAVVMLTSILGNFPGVTSSVTELAGSIAVSVVLLGSTGTLIDAAVETVQELSSYAKLLLPVMTTAMAAQGGITRSTALYTGTAVFDAVLSSLICTVMIPIIYIFIALSIGKSALGDDLLGKLHKFTKWLVTWCLKTVLYVFTGYMTITGVVSGTTDQAALKATKLTISGMVPVVGGILSDASEAVLVGAGAVKNAVGIYGLIAIFAIAIGPFLKIGVQYLLLKLTAAVCATFGSKRTTGLIEDICSAMGLLLAMTGAVCLMMLISVVCFLKGVS